MLIRAPISPLQPALFGRPPAGQPRLNIAHPLAHKLFAAYVLNQPYTAENLVTKARSDILKNQTSGDGGMVDHRGMRFVATHGGATDDHFKVDHFDVQAADVVSFAVGFTTKTFLTTAARGAGVLAPGLHALGLGPFAQIVSSGGTQRLKAGLKMSSSWGAWSDNASASNPAINLGEDVNFACCVANDASNGPDDGRAFQGQQSLIMVGPGFNDASTATGDLYLANNAGSAHASYYNFDGHIAYYYSWKRALSDDELKAVNANPYAPFGIPLILDDAVPDMLWRAGGDGGGAAPITGTVTLAAAGALTASLTKTGLGDLALAASGAVAATTQKSTTASAAIAAAGLVATSGHKLTVSGAPVTGVGALALAGLKIAITDADISAPGALSVAARKIATTDVALTRIGALSATASKIAIGTVALDANGAAIITALKATTATLILDATGAITVTTINPDGAVFVETIHLRGTFTPNPALPGEFIAAPSLAGAFNPVIILNKDAS